MENARTSKSCKGLADSREETDIFASGRNTLSHTT